MALAEGETRQDPGAPFRALPCPLHHAGHSFTWGLTDVNFESSAFPAKLDGAQGHGRGEMGQVPVPQELLTWQGDLGRRTHGGCQRAEALLLCVCSLIKIRHCNLEKNGETCVSSSPYSRPSSLAVIFPSARLVCHDPPFSLGVGFSSAV